MDVSSQSVEPVGRCDELAEKRSLVHIQVVPLSELPYRVTLRRSGVVLGSFESRERVDSFIDTVSLTTLKPVVTRRKRSR